MSPLFLILKDDLFHVEQSESIPKTSANPAVSIPGSILIEITGQCHVISPSRRPRQPR